VAYNIRFYTDEHSAHAVAEGLKRRGVDVLTTYAADMLGASDEKQLAFAIKEERAVFTQDTDFLKMHATGKEHYGIVYAPQGKSIGEIVRGLMLIYELLDKDDMKNHIEFL
jgi:predicted nuclease of predicted toxin-antitoxin system